MTRCWCVTGPGPGPAICIVLLQVRVTPCMMMAQLRTPGYGTSARPGGPGAQSLPRHPGVTFGGHWTWTQRSRGRLQTAPADDRQVATGRNYNYTQKKLQIMGKSNLWRAGPTQQPAPSLLCLCERLMGQFFKISAREQSSAYCLCWCWNSTFSPSKHFCANLNYVTFFPVFSAVPWCFFAGLKYLRIGLGLD